MTDEQFVRRVYLDMAGRIPNYQEATGFDITPAYTAHTYNYFAEMLRP